MFSGQDFRVQIRQLAWGGAAGLEIELREVARRPEAVGDRSIFPDGPATHTSRVFHHIFRLATRNCQPHQMVAAALLKSEIHGAAVRRPSRSTLAIVQNGSALESVPAAHGYHP